MKSQLHEIPTAGALPDRKKTSDTALSCMTLPAEKEVPQAVEKYRKSAIPAGSRVLHPGLVDDFRTGEHLTKKYGAGGAQVDDAWRTQRPSEMDDQMRQAREQVYASAKREPLGKTFSRNFQLPASDDPRGHIFGKAFSDGRNDNRGGLAAKTALYPSAEAKDDVHREQYIKSHHAYDVGQQKSRAYQWPGGIAQNQQDHVFGVGVGSHKAMNNTSANIKQQFEAPGGNAVVSERVESIQNLKDQLGRCRHLMQDRNVDPSFVYGRSDRRADDWDAKACLEGDYAPGEQAPDADLGQSVTPGFRKDPNLVKEGNLHHQHAFGTPSIRSDIGVKSFKSVADSNNYGDDVTAQYLLYPPNSQSLGVEADDFTRERSKGDLFKLFEAVQGAHQDDPAMMEQAWASALMRRGQTVSDHAKMSLVEFRAVFNDIHH